MRASAGTKIGSLLLLPFLLAMAGPPEPPAAIAANIRDGQFDAGDFRWLRGHFKNASPSDVAAYRSIERWRHDCRVHDLAIVREELRALGIVATNSLDAIPYRSLPCDQVATLPEPLDENDFNAFERDVALVKPFIESFMAAVSAIEKVKIAPNPDVRDQLINRALAEQSLRSGMSWAKSPRAADTAIASLTPQQRGIIVAVLAMRLAERDRANTNWLKSIVKTEGWPMKSKVGDAAARAAWLLAQHADADPAFQVQSLRLMEPLVKSGEADQRSFALLQDRVLLKIVGKQRYATQLICQGGQLKALPLEDEANVDVRRAQIGLGRLSDYVKRSIEGRPCPAD